MNTTENDLILVPGWLKNHGYQDDEEWVREKLLPRMLKHLKKGGWWAPGDDFSLKMIYGMLYVKDLRDGDQFRMFNPYEEYDFGLIMEQVREVYVYETDLEGAVLQFLAEDIL